MVKIWKISKKEYDRIKALNNNGFYNRRALEFKGKYYEHSPNASLSEIYKWQQNIRKEQEAAEERKKNQQNLFES